MSTEEEPTVAVGDEPVASEKKEKKEKKKKERKPGQKSAWLPTQWFGKGKIVDVSWDRPVRALLSMMFLLWAFSYAIGYISWGSASLIVGWDTPSVVGSVGEAALDVADGDPKKAKDLLDKILKNVCETQRARARVNPGHATRHLEAGPRRGNRHDCRQLKPSTSPKMTSRRTSKSPNLRTTKKLTGSHQEYEHQKPEISRKS